MKTPTTVTGRFLRRSNDWPSSVPLKRPRMRAPTMTSSPPGFASRPAVMCTCGRKRERVARHAANLDIGDAGGAELLHGADDDDFADPNRLAGFVPFHAWGAEDRIHAGDVEPAAQLGVAPLAQDDRHVVLTGDAERLLDAGGEHQSRGEDEDDERDAERGRERRGLAHGEAADVVADGDHATLLSASTTRSRDAAMAGNAAARTPSRTARPSAVAATTGGTRK